MRVPDVGKIQFVGIQDEKIYLDFSTRQLAAMGIDRDQVIADLQAQNAVAPAGVVQAGAEKVTVRVSGEFTSEESLAAINLRADGKFYRLADVAQVRRGYADPPSPIFRYNGQPAIGMIISMAAGGNVLEFGEGIRERMHRIEANLPIGIETHLVANQAVVVEEAVAGFTKALAEAVVIVLAVSFVSLGLRAGVVVAFSIPLVLAMTFIGMEYFGIQLQRISLGALIIALGLLVDDAMITVEMMITKLEEGFSLDKAATFAYTSTAFPMLTGTLVTVAGFIPIGFAQGGAAEYCFTLFAVVAMALLFSWIVAVLFAPLIGVNILKVDPKKQHAHGGEPGRLMRLFRATLRFAMRARYLVIIVSVGLFAASVFGLNFVQQQFFPASDRPELLVNLTLPQTASIRATEEVVDRFEKVLAADPEIEHWSFYVGQGAIRFYLPLDVQLANDYFAQAVVVTKGLEVRDAVRARLEKVLNEDFSDLNARISPLELGPPVGWPIQYRISGPDIAQVREAAYRLADTIGTNPYTLLVNYDWNEPSKVVRVDVDQDKARLLGISSKSLNEALNATVSGTAFTQVRDNIYLIDVVAQATNAERSSIETLRNLQVAIPDGRIVPLGEVAALGYDLEQPLVWRRARLPTITVQADLVPPLQAATVVDQLAPAVDAAAAQPAAGLFDRGGRHGREQRQGHDLDHGGLPGHGLRDADHPDDPAPELPEAHPGDQRGPARPDRRGRGAAADRHAAGLRRHPRRGGPDRDDRPQLGHHDRADRRAPGGGGASLGRRDQRHDAPRAADPADGGRRQPRHDPDSTRSLLGTHGVRDHRRPDRGHGADPAVPAGPLRHLVPHQGAGKGDDGRGRKAHARRSRRPATGGRRVRGRRAAREGVGAARQEWASWQVVGRPCRTVSPCRGCGLVRGCCGCPGG